MGKKHLLAAAAASCILLGISGARAADVDVMPEPVAEQDWYVSLFGGVAWLEDFDTEYDYQGGSYTADVQTDTGFIIGGALGTHLTEDIRVEIEVAYSENDAEDRRFDGDDFDFALDGSIDIWTFMVNLWYDIPLSDEIKPYLGGGAGIAIVDGDVSYEGDAESIFDSSEVEFAFQVGGGLRWALSEHFTLDVGYRFKGVDGPKFGGSDFPGSSDYDSDWLFSHNVIAGISFGF